MKNSDIKLLIRKAYSIESSEKKRKFIRTYEKRELNYTEMLYVQVQYMGIQLTLVCGYVLAMLLGTIARIDADLAKLSAAFMPVMALIALTGLGKSERYRMKELEMATRLSLRMAKILRIAIIGIVGIAAMLAVSYTLKIAAGADMINAFAMAGISYFATTFFCMLLIRKWHSEKNIYGCIAIALCVCMAMFDGIRILGLYSASICRLILLPLLSAAIILTAIGAFGYIREREDLKWNLC